MLSFNLTQGNSEQRRNAEVVVRAQASRIHRENEYWSRNLLHTVQEHLQSLRHFEGRKSLVLVSDGFLAQQLRYEMQGVVHAALRSGTILSTVDMRGLYTTAYRASEVAALATEATLSQMSMRVENIRAQSQPMAQLALETGGVHFHNDNDLFGGLKQIADSQSFYYVLTYASPATESDGRYHRIEVKVSRPGLEVTHRNGYYAPREDPTYITLKKREVLDALRAPGNLNEVPIHLSYNAFPVGEDRYQVDLFTRIDFGRLPLPGKEGPTDQSAASDHGGLRGEGRLPGGAGEAVGLEIDPVRPAGAGVPGGDFQGYPGSAARGARAQGGGARKRGGRHRLRPGRRSSWPDAFLPVIPPATGAVCWLLWRRRIRQAQFH